MQFSSLVTFGHAIQHSFILAWSHMNTSMTCQVIKECILFIFPAPQMGSGKKNMHDSLGIVEHVWKPLLQSVRFPKLLRSIRQTLAGEILTSAAIAMHKILHVRSSTDFACSMWCSSTADVGGPLRGASSISFGPSLMVFTHWQTVLYEGACVPKPSFNDL
jgi:hypothetical protein